MSIQNLLLAIIGVSVAALTEQPFWPRASISQDDEAPRLRKRLSGPLPYVRLQRRSRLARPSDRRVRLLEDAQGTVRLAG
jgi:hypothetical protein